MDKNGDKNTPYIISKTLSGISYQTIFHVISKLETFFLGITNRKHIHKIYIFLIEYTYNTFDNN